MLCISLLELFFQKWHPFLFCLLFVDILSFTAASNGCVRDWGTVWGVWGPPACRREWDHRTVQRHGARTGGPHSETPCTTGGPRTTLPGELRQTFVGESSWFLRRNEPVLNLGSTLEFAVSEPHLDPSTWWIFALVSVLMCTLRTCVNSYVAAKIMLSSPSRVQHLWCAGSTLRAPKVMFNPSSRFKGRSSGVVAHAKFTKQVRPCLSFAEIGILLSAHKVPAMPHYKMLTNHCALMGFCV